MIILSNTLDSVKVELGGSVATNQVSLIASWRDITATPTYVAGRSVAVSNSTTQVTWIAAPAASTQRVIDHARVVNRDTAPVVVRVYYDANGTQFLLWSATLQPGEIGIVHPINTGAPGPSGIDGSDGALIVHEAEIDLGSTPVLNKTVVVPHVGMTNTAKILASQSGAAATDRTADENAWDSFVINCVAGTDEFTANIHAPLYLSGKFKIHYQFST